MSVPAHPGGYAVDLIRSCYQTRMRFYRDSEESVAIRWYATPPGAPWMPYPTRFASGNWSADKAEWTGPGEVPGASRPYRNCDCCAFSTWTMPFGGAETHLRGAVSGAATALAPKTVCQDAEYGLAVGVTAEVVTGSPPPPAGLLVGVTASVNGPSLSLSAGLLVGVTAEVVASTAPTGLLVGVTAEVVTGSPPPPTGLLVGVTAEVVTGSPPPPVGLVIGITGITEVIIDPPPGP